MRAIRMVALLAGVLLATTALAHDIRYSVNLGEAVSVDLEFPYGDAPTHEPYEIYRPGGETPFQAGRSDGLGRVTFMPDEPGDWRLRIVTQDGHGLDITVTVDASGGVERVHGPGHGRIAAVTAGLGYIVGLAGILLWWHRRRTA